MIGTHAAGPGTERHPLTAGPRKLSPGATKAMAGPDQKRMLAARKRPSASGGAGRERRNQATLEIGSDVISDDGIRGLLEEWLIPMIVEDLIHDRMKSTARSDPPRLTPRDIS